LGNELVIYLKINMPVQKKNDPKKKGAKHHTQPTDVPISPIHSESHEKVDILNDEEIQSFAIKPMELEKIRQDMSDQATNRSGKKLQVQVKRKMEVRKQTPVKDKVVVAKAMVDTKANELDYSGPAGPRYTNEGHIVHYSLVGPVEDFIKEAVLREQLTANSPAATIASSRSVHGHMAMYDRPEPIPEHPIKMVYDQNKALNRWHQHINKRIINQKKIAKKIDRNVGDLVMNANCHSNAKMETKKLIEYVTPFYDNSTALPSVNGCEFWKRPDQIGGEDGISTTLTKTQKGFPYYYEHIRQPLSIQKETGIYDPGEKTTKAGKSRDFENIDYLKRKKLAMGELIKQIHPHKPNLDSLEVRHHKAKLHNPDENIPKQASLPSRLFTPHPTHGFNSFDSSELYSSPEKMHTPDRHSQPPAFATMSTNLINNQDAPRRRAKYADSKNPISIADTREALVPDNVRVQTSLGEFPDAEVKYFDGPSVRLNEEVARWNGSSGDRRGENGLQVRMTFNSAINKRDEMQLRIENNGTTSMSFQWNKIPTPPKFSIIQKDEVQRFYFNIGDGVILPGGVIMLPFTFKSPNAGIFTELWRFSTQPVVMGGASLHIILKGVATQESDHVNMTEMCRQIDLRLDKCEAKSIVNRMLSDLIRGIRTPERCPSPIENHVTEEELFLEKNIGMFYNFEGVSELRLIYEECLRVENSDDVIPPWSLSVADLRHVIRYSSVNCDVTENLLKRVNDVITAKLCAKLITPPTNINYNACMSSLQTFLDEMSSCSIYLKSIKDINFQSETNPVVESVASLAPIQNSASGKAKGPKLLRKTVKLAQMVKMSPKVEETIRESSDVTNLVSMTSYASLSNDDYDKYREKFTAMTRELLVETLEIIFGLFEDYSQL